MKRIATALCLFVACVAGCGVDSKISDEQAEKERESKLFWLDKSAEIARKHGLSWQANLDIGGRPRAGQELAFFFDSDVQVRIAMQGNAAAAHRPVVPPTDTAPETIPKATKKQAEDDGAHTVAQPTNRVRYVTEINGDEVAIVGFNNGKEVSREVLPP